MRIALDVSAAAKPRRSGIGWYTANLARALPARLGEADQLLLCTRLSRLRQRRHRPAPEGPRVARRWFQEPLPPRGAPEVFHGPDARLPRGLGPARCALVATVHDVFSLQSDRFAGPRFRERKARQYADVARRAARVVFPSRASRDAYLEHFPEVAGRDAVVPEGVDPRFAPSPPGEVAEARRRYGLPERFALYVGAISRRKNLPLQARALAASGTALPWVWVGAASSGADAIVDEVRASGVELRRLGYVPLADLPALYSAAALLTFATCAEGFGLPALEAMACGTPALVANRGALPELTAGCAAEVDPDSPEEIAAAIRRIARGEAGELGRRGRARAGAFTWERTARETLDVYRAAFRERAAP